MKRDSSLQTKASLLHPQNVLWKWTLSNDIRIYIWISPFGGGERRMSWKLIISSETDSGTFFHTKQFTAVLVRYTTV